MNVDPVGIMWVGIIILSGFDIIPPGTKADRVYSHLPSKMNYVYVYLFGKVKIVYLYD